MESARKVDELIDALRRGSKFARGNAAYTLGRLGERASPALIEALNSENAEVRKYTAYPLGKIGDSMAVPALNHATRDVHWGVRQWAEVALKKIRSEQGSRVAWTTRRRNRGDDSAPKLEQIF